MKKIMTLVAAMLMAVAVNASNKSVEYATEAPGKVAPFSEVNVNVPSRMKRVPSLELQLRNFCIILLSFSFTKEGCFLPECDTKFGRTQCLNVCFGQC